MAGLQVLEQLTGTVLIERDVVETIAQLLQKVGDRLEQALPVARFDLRLHTPDQLLDGGKGMLPGNTFLPLSQVRQQHHIVPALAQDVDHRERQIRLRDTEIIEHLSDATPRNQQLLLATCDLVDALLGHLGATRLTLDETGELIVDQRKQADIVAEIVEYSGYCGLDAAV